MWHWYGDFLEAYISEDPAAVRLLYARPPESTAETWDTWWTPGGHLRRLPFCKPVSVVQSVENLGEILAPQRNSELRFDQDLPKLLSLKMAIPLDFCCFSYQAHVWLFDLEILELLGVFCLSNLQNDWNPWNSSLPIVLTGFSTMFQNVFRSSPRLVIS